MTTSSKEIPIGSTISLPASQTRLGRRSRTTMLLLAGLFLALTDAAAENPAQTDPEEATQPDAAAAQEENPQATALDFKGMLHNLYKRQQWMEQEIARLGEMNRALQQAKLQAENVRQLVTEENAKFVAALAEERKSAQLTNETLRSQLQNLQQQMAAAETQGGQIAARFAELEAVRDRALSANLKLQAEKRTLEQQLESGQQSQGELMQRLESLQANLHSNQAGYEMLAEEKAKIEATLQEASQRIAAMSQQIEVAQGAQRDSMAEIGRLTETGSRMKGQLALQVQTAKEAAGLVAKAEQMLTAAESSNQQLVQEKEQLRLALAQAEAKLIELGQQLKTAQDSHAQALTQSEGVKSALQAEKTQVESRAAQAEAQVTELGQQLKTAQDSHARVLAQSEDVKLALQAEKTQLESKVAQAEAQVADLRQQLTTAQDSHAQALTDSESARSQLQADKTQLETTAAQTQAETSDLQQRIKVLEETHSGAVAAVERLQQEKADLQASVEADQKAAAESKAQLETELASMRSQLPAAAGGSVTDEHLQQQATEHASALRELHDKRGEMDAEAWDESRGKLEAQLRDQQFTLAQSVSASSVYQVQPKDTLLRISRKIYGTSNRWTEIHEANHHLLEDPDRLFPGMTLIIP